MKYGVVDVGGGLRGIYAAGVLDYCMDAGITFDLGVGVSAGAANLASFIAGQRGRNIAFFMEYPFRKEYMSMKNMLRKREYLDLEYIYGTLSNSDGEDPFDVEAFQRNPMDYIAVSADARTGEAVYFPKASLQKDSYQVLMASSAIPFFCQPVMIDGVPHYDGALGDPVPVQKAFDLGCDRVVLLLTKPKYQLRKPDKDQITAARIRRRYPAAAKNLCLRARRYNAAVERAMELEREGKVLIVAPDDTCGVDTLTKNKTALGQLYEKGFRDGAAVAEFLAGR